MSYKRAANDDLRTLTKRVKAEKKIDTPPPVDTVDKPISVDSVDILSIDPVDQVNSAIETVGLDSLISHIAQKVDVVEAMTSAAKLFDLAMSNITCKLEFGDFVSIALANAGKNIQFERFEANWNDNSLQKTNNILLDYAIFSCKHIAAVAHRFANTDKQKKVLSDSIERIRVAKGAKSVKAISPLPGWTTLSLAVFCVPKQILLSLPLSMSEKFSLFRGPGLTLPNTILTNKSAKKTINELVGKSKIHPMFNTDNILFYQRIHYAKNNDLKTCRWGDRASTYRVFYKVKKIWAWISDFIRIARKNDLTKPDQTGWNFFDKASVSQRMRLFNFIRSDNADQPTRSYSSTLDFHPVLAPESVVKIKNKSKDTKNDRQTPRWSTSDAHKKMIRALKSETSLSYTTRVPCQLVEMMSKAGWAMDSSRKNPVTFELDDVSSSPTSWTFSVDEKKWTLKEIKAWYLKLKKEYTAEMVKLTGGKFKKA